MHKEKMRTKPLPQKTLVAGIFYSMATLPLYISIESWRDGNTESLLICIAMTCSFLWFALNPSMLIKKGSIAAIFSQDNLWASRGRLLPYSALGLIALSGILKVLSG